MYMILLLPKSCASASSASSCSTVVVFRNESRAVVQLSTDRNQKSVSVASMSPFHPRSIFFFRRLTPPVSACLRRLFLLRCLLSNMFLLLLLLPLLPKTCASASSASSCSTVVVFRNESRVFANCVALPTQRAILAWTLTQDKSGATTVSDLEVLFQGNTLSPSGWAGWGINPDALAMEGTQAFLAFSTPNGGIVLPFNVSRGSKDSGILTGPVSLHVLSILAEMVDTSVSFVLTIRIDTEKLKSANVVWNRGTSVAEFRPNSHGFSSDDLASMTTLDFTSTAPPPHYNLKVAHAVLSVLGWGFILPTAIVAHPRDLRGSLISRFHIHIALHISGFFVGTAGWATGLYIGFLSKGVTDGAHRCVGIIVFAMVTLNLLFFGAMSTFFVPGVHRSREIVCAAFYYALGAITIVLVEVNIYLGNAILPLAASPTSRISFIAVQCVTLLLKLLISFCHRGRPEAAAADPENPQQTLLQNKK